MSDRLLFVFMGLASVMMIALAMVWPQGQGAPTSGAVRALIAQPAAAK